jgi:hypothetical protein
MKSDPTEYPRKIEPTQQANPYEYTSPYYDLPDIPPPPPPMKKKHHTFLWVVFGLLLVLILVLTSFIGVQQYERSSSNARTAVPTTLSAQPTIATKPTIQPTLQPTKNTSYTAQSIVADFQAHDLPTDNLHYNKSLYQFLGNDIGINVKEQSSATFIDTSICNSICYSETNQIWLGIYTTSTDAEIAEHETASLVSWQMRTSNGAGPVSAYYNIQLGKCLILNEPQTSVYVQILKQDCT